MSRISDKQIIDTMIISNRKSLIISLSGCILLSLLIVSGGIVMGVWY